MAFPSPFLKLCISKFQSMLVFFLIVSAKRRTNESPFKVKKCFKRHNFISINLFNYNRSTLKLSLFMLWLQFRSGNSDKFPYRNLLHQIKKEIISLVTLKTSRQGGSLLESLPHSSFENHIKRNMVLCKNKTKQH